jgi:hypothetical protein
MSTQTVHAPERGRRPRTLPLLLLLLPLLAPPLRPAEARAQASETLHACFVPGSGTVYRIAAPGLPAECLASEHVRFSWSTLGTAGGDLSGSFPNPTVARLQGRPVAGTAPAEGQVLRFDGTAWAPAAPPGGGGGVTAHGQLSGLASDDHPQYLLASGGRALAGNLSAGGFRVTNLAAATAAGEAVRFEQAIKAGDAAAGDLSGSFPGPTVARLQGRAVANTAPTQGQVLTFDGQAWAPATPASSGGVTAHGQLTGLQNDDHPQYLLADGVRASTNGFAVTGTLNTGSIPATGAGVRLMWYPGKAAFRAGRVQGTHWDDASVGMLSVAFGDNTRASGERSTAMGGQTTASGQTSTAMGHQTSAGGNFSTAMGFSTTASGGSSTAMGHLTAASGNFSTAMGDRTVASGEISTAIGSQTTASGVFSTAMGRFASTSGQTGAFVYGDASVGDSVRATRANQFVVRAQHVWLGTNNSVSNPTGHFLTTSTGAHLTTGGAWTNSSDASRKEAFEAVDADEVLERLARLPIRSWRYREEAGARHLGPTAQDFHVAFGLGGSETAIATVDADGVALLAIQALERRNRELQEEVVSLREKAYRAETLERRVAELEDEMAVLRELKTGVAALQAEITRLQALLESAPATVHGDRND